MGGFILRRWWIMSANMLRFSTIMFAIALCITPLGAFAQQKVDPNETTEAIPDDTKTKPVEQTAAPYDDKLLRLSEVLGSIHYLRALCGAREGNKWRDHMSEIIKSEAPEPAREARIIARFNRGYRAFDQTYGSCTNSALTAANRYMKEGVLLSSQITSRYGR